MKWNDESIKKTLIDVIQKQGFKRMPTQKELLDLKLSGLNRAISLTGGFEKWALILQLDRKKKNNYWTEETIEKKIIETMNTYNLKTIPTSSDLKRIHSNGLDAAITRNGGYRYWRKKIGVMQKEGTNLKGETNERIIQLLLQNKGYTAELTALKFPYDILINGSVKVETKIASPHYGQGKYREHFFHLRQKLPKSDISVFVLLDESNQIERTLIIPTHHLNVITLSVGKQSTYNKYQDRWDYIELFTEFYSNVR